MTLTQDPPTSLATPAPARPASRTRERAAVAVLLIGTALLYLVKLGDSGWANSFYAAAVQAGSSSWKAFFFGSSDASNFITVDKTPASLWVMDLSARIFGLNAWSMLVPQALEGVAAVGLLYLTVRRWFGVTAGLIAGAVLALTPVAVLMFRFNNPDALLVVLLVASAYAMTRAIETASTRWLLLAGSLIGFGFLTKMLQAFLVVPVFALVYLVTAPTGLRRRILQTLYAGVALIVSAGWWVLIVSLIPAADRPYIGGSQHNSVLELAFGYNGLGRLSGDETGSVGGGGAGPGGGNGGGMWGSTGWTRMFGSDIGGQIAWLLPAALLLLAAGLWLVGRASRTDRKRAAFLLWGGWLLVTGLVFSFMQGIFHPYYTVALAPAIGALVGMGSVELWRARKDHILAGPVLAGVVAVTAVTAFILLRRSADWHPWLAYAVLIIGIGAAAVLLVVGWLGRRIAVGLGVATLVVALAGPAAYAGNTASTTHTGSIPSAGPVVSGGFGPGGSMRGGRPGGFGGGPQFGNDGTLPGAGQQQGQFGGGTGAPGTGSQGNGGQNNGGLNNGGAFGAGGPGGGMGGLLDASTPDSQLVAALTANADQYTWVAATVGSNNAAGLQLAARKPVMSIGGFNGSDPAPTLAQFQSYVAAGKIHYFLGGGNFGGQNGGSGNGSQIAAWVAANYTAQTIGGQTVYDLSQAAS